MSNRQKMVKLKLILTGNLPSKIYGESLEYELLDSTSIKEVRKRVKEGWTKKGMIVQFFNVLTFC